ncbi:hypothetical protein P3580_06635 [Vibrio parahaemolyticus]|nr:hypothetical protein [Vibrio parahaemolyticus]MDF4948296.1 hypothetical protein [Vibrio parahaemolyticus]
MGFTRLKEVISKNKIVISIAALLTATSYVYEAKDTGIRFVQDIKQIIGYEQPILVTVQGDGAVEKRLKLAKLEASNYSIPSSSAAVIKFLSLPWLNSPQSHIAKTEHDYTFAIVTTVSPISSTSSEHVFDGGDCRLGVRASNIEKDKMIATFDIVSLSCTDNSGYAYSIEPDYPIGYISALSTPGINKVKIVDNDSYLTIDPEKNYYAQLYHPLEKIDKLGVSFVGRF